MSKINKTPIETRLAIERRSAAMLPDRPTQAGYKPWDIRNALFSAIIADKGACLMGEIDRIVDETNAAIDAMRIKRGTLTVPQSHWKGEETPRAECVVRSIYTAGCAVLFMPEDDETKEQARLARLSMAINETVDGEWSDVVVFAGAGGTIPSVDLHFRYVVMPTESEEDAIVALVGVDAYGEGGGTASGVDEEAVKALIGKEVPAWAMEKQKPTYTADEVKARPATWTPTAAEVGARPSTWMPTADEVGARPNTWIPTAGEVGAESAGKVKDHNEDSGSHTDIRLDITTIRTMLNTVIGTDTGKSMRAVAALVVAEIVGDASDSFDTLEEIAAWIEAHPNDVAAMVKRITDLETAMGGKVSKTDIINTLDNTALDKPLSAAMGAKLNTMLAEMSDELDGKATPEQVTKAISDALAGYALKDHNHDGTYIKQTELNGAVNTALQIAKESGEFDGESVTVSKVTESEESGGENVVEFSNGKKLTVLNGWNGRDGRDAKDGKTPVKGVDYFTSAEISNIRNEIGAELSQIPTPAIVSSVDEMTDTTKHYVLQSSGHIYASRTIQTGGDVIRTPNFTNLFNRAAVTLNAYIGGTDDAAEDGSFVTGLMPFDIKSLVVPQVIRIANWYGDIGYHKRNKIAWYPSGAFNLNCVDQLNSPAYVLVDSSNLDLQIITCQAGKIPNTGTATTSKITGFKLSFRAGASAITLNDIPDDMIITVNEEITYTETTTPVDTVTEWYDTGISYSPTFKTDLVGVMGENNVIYLSNNLPSGTYTLVDPDNNNATVGTITI